MAGCGAFTTEEPVSRNHVPVYVIIHKDVHGNQMMTATPFAKLMVFIVAVVMDQELCDEQPFLFTVFLVQVFKHRLRVLDASNAVVFEIKDIHLPVYVRHKTVRIVSVG